MPLGYFSKDEYSQKELDLIETIGCTYLIEQVPGSRIYDMMAHKCFLENRQDSAAASVRRCVIALDKCEIYRKDPRWDAMIEL